MDRLNPRARSGLLQLRHQLSCSVRVLILSLVATIPLTNVTNADEPVQEFMNALRARGYYDVALEYIEQQRQNPKLSADLKQSLGYERAMTLLEMSRTSRTSGDKAKTLADAQGALQQFSQQNPRHPLAAKANSQLGNILLERARAAIWQVDSPGGRSKEDLRSEARQLLSQARGIFQKAYDQWSTKLKSFPAHPDPSDKEQYAAFKEAQTAELANGLALAKCSYENGQTHARGSKKRSETLIAASDEFRDIHERYRRWIGGLTARLWQGKCLEETDDIKRALGIYNEVLSHGDDDPKLRDLKSLALRFRLICLNHDKKKDYQLAIVQSTNWLGAEGKSQARTENAVAIRWQKARAHDYLSQSLKEENPERDRQVKLALSEATEVGRYETAYKDVANAMVTRLKSDLGQKDGPIKDFEVAFDRARKQIKQIGTYESAVASAGTSGAKIKAEEDLKLTLSESGDLLTLALDLANAKDDETKVMQARYLLGFVKYKQRRSIEAIVLARHVMNHGGKLDPETALNAAEVAMVGCVQAFNDAGSDHEDEMQMLEWISNEIIKQWPDSSRANEARMSLGMINNRANRPDESSKWYEQVPESAPQFGEAQLAAGQTWWRSSLSAGQNDDGAEVDPNRIKQMTQNAEKHLRTGLKAMLNPAVMPPASVTAAKLSLAQIQNSKGKFDESIKLLTDGDQSIMKAIAVPDGDRRPESGIKGRDFSGLAYQVLLRAYVGTQRIDDALDAMSEMEKIGGPDTQIYVQLGRELEREIERLKNQNETARLAELRTSFEQFLAKVFERKDRQNYNSLIWVAETYRGLGQGLSDDPETASTYFQRAAASYQQIIDKNLVNDKQKTSVELRLVNCRRSMKDYSSAMQLLKGILAQHPRDMNAQFEAAYLLQDWGNNGQPEKLGESIAGSDDQKIWGWLSLGQRLRNPNFRDKYFESRYAMVESRRDYARVGGADRKSARMKAAVRDIELLVSTQGAFEQPWWGKFDSLYRSLQREMGVLQPKGLEKPEEFVANPVVEKLPQEAAQDVEDKVTQPVAAVTPKKAEQGSGLMGLLIALPVALLAVGGMWFFMSKPRKRPAAAAASSAPAPSFDSISVPQPTAKPRKSSPKKRSAPATAKRQTAPAGTAPKKKLTPEQIAARKAKQARAAKQAAASGQAPPKKAGAKKKIVIKKKTADAPPVDPTAKKRVKVARKAPKKPPEAS